MKKLIINADDFALHNSVNNAIIKANNSGVLTSTSIIPCGKCFNLAVDLAKSNDNLGVGVHLTLVYEKPLSDQSKVKSLVTEEGLFHENYIDFIKKMLKNEINYHEVYNELSMQIAKVKNSGIKITHLDSHQHLHVLPKITDIVIDLAISNNIKAIRIPDEPFLFMGGYPFNLTRLVGRSGLTFLSKLARVKIGQKLYMPDHFFGMLAGGNMREEYLLNIIRSLPHGVTEIMVHPADNNNEMNELYSWRYCWEDELAALTSDLIKKEINKQEIELISFGDLVND